jgi:ParB/RepB/Spo0J family partition protein
VPLSSLTESPTNPRKHFDQKKLDELAASIKERGVLEPILIRKNGKEGSHEIVAGTRRFRASKLAGKTDIPAILCEFSDDEVLEVQLEENDQRDDLTPLDRAEAYAVLAARGKSVKDIARVVKRKTSEVAATLALVKLPKPVKDALASGLIDLRYTNLIARIPDTKLQEIALVRIVPNYGSGAGLRAPVPYALAKQIVEEEFMAPLSAAPFDPEDATLSPLGACAACPHLASNNRDLFGDVKAKAICTNPRDFRLKTENYLKRLRENGHTVLLSKDEVRRAFPQEGNPHYLAKGYVDLEDVCPADPKARTYETLLSRPAKLKTVYALVENRVRKLYPSAALPEALTASGHAFAKPQAQSSKGSGNGSGSGKESASKANDERVIADAVAVELARKLCDVKLGLNEWIDLVLRIVIADAPWNFEKVFRRHGFDGTAQDLAKHRERIISERVMAMSAAEKRSFLIDLLVGSWGTSIEKQHEAVYREVLGLAGVNPVTVGRRALAGATRGKATPPPAANLKRQVARAATPTS